MKFYLKRMNRGFFIKNKIKKLKTIKNRKIITLINGIVIKNNKIMEIILNWNIKIKSKNLLNK
jgi:hypothetical protein